MIMGNFIFQTAEKVVGYKSTTPGGSNSKIVKLRDMCTLNTSGGLVFTWN